MQIRTLHAVGLCMGEFYAGGNLLVYIPRDKQM
jgi:hypothetical protein